MTDLSSKSPSSPPAESECKIKQHIQTATDALHEALQRREMWRVFAQDKELHRRLGARSLARDGFFELRRMVFDALVVALTRMFDKPSKRHRPLSILALCEEVDKPEIRADVAERREADRKRCETVRSRSASLSDADREIIARSGRAEALDVKRQVEGEFDALLAEAKMLENVASSQQQALSRLKQLRNKLIAHRDMDFDHAITATYQDLETVFTAASSLLRQVANLVDGRGPNIAIDWAARERAKCLVAGMRAETREERTAAMAYARSLPPEFPGSL